MRNLQSSSLYITYKRYTVYIYIYTHIHWDHSLTKSQFDHVRHTRKSSFAHQAPFLPTYMFHQLSREVGLCSPAERAGPFLRGGFKDFWNFHPYLGKGSNLTNICQMG